MGRVTGVYFYRMSGLSVRSDLALPGLVDAAAEDLPDVLIQADDVPMAIDNPMAIGPTWQMGKDSILLRIPDVARFQMYKGRSITYEAEGGTPVDELAIFLIGTVFGILLHQREQIVLHASSVQVNGKAVLFCGPSGAGKSTLAAALVSRGYALVTDDICAIRFDNGHGPVAYPDGRRLKLWEQAIQELNLVESREAAVRRQLQKFYIRPADAFSDPLPLGAIYALRDARPPHAPGIEQPNVVDGALTLRRNAYRPLLVNRMGQMGSYFFAAAKIANAAPIRWLNRPLDFEKMPEVISWLERHWEEAGLTAKAA